MGVCKINIRLWLTMLISILSLLLIVYLYLGVDDKNILTTVLLIIFSVIIYKFNLYIMSKSKYKSIYYQGNRNFRIKKMYLIWFTILIYVLNNSLLKPIFMPHDKPENQKNIDKYMSEVAFSDSLFNIGISSPIIEEVIFRGLLLVVTTCIVTFIYSRTVSMTNTLNIVIYILFIVVSSIIFGLAHVYSFEDYNHVAPYIISGVVYSLFYLFTKTLWAPILVHGLNNLLNTLAKGYMIKVLPVDIATISIIIMLIYFGITAYVWVFKNNDEINETVENNMKNIESNHFSKVVKSMSVSFFKYVNYKMKK